MASPPYYFINRRYAFTLPGLLRRPLENLGKLPFVEGGQQILESPHVKGIIHIFFITRDKYVDGLFDIFPCNKSI